MQAFVKGHIEKKLEREIVLEKPKDIHFGHFATPVAFSLAKQLRKNPIIIAEDLVLNFVNDDIFEDVIAVKGFVNFKLSENFLSQKIDEALDSGDLFAKGKSNKKRILLEYVSANPTGPLHIGHARGAVFGDALSRVGKYLGYDIQSEYYVNDAGSQMNLLGLSVYLAGQESILKLNVEYPEQYYRGDYLFDIAQLCEEKFGKEIFEDPNRQDELSLFAKDKVITLIKNDMLDLGIEFDNYVSEKSLYPSWGETKAKLEESGSIYRKNNKDWIKSTELGDDVDRVVVRDSGIPTYLAGDIIYHKNKYDRKFDKYINIWGADHHGYIARVKASIKFLGNDPDQLEIILSQMVSLLKGGQPYKMSKRAGNVILMSDIVEEIGADSLRFIFLTKKSDTHLEFDIDTLKNEDSSNPVFYINYAHARINQLFKKAEQSLLSVKEANMHETNQDTKDMVYEALLLPSILEEAFLKRDMQKITDYLYSLSARVHKFYNNHKIVKATQQDSYLKALSMASLSIKTGLQVLGITAKEVM
ncbi:Arginyl-tRNA synthetase [hydrothermal vent metagenome]|uniref:arginine--tRNA ligase n=1 Tax=hydrothermal vent metagenome TaxID=652676 RepID=A0A3B1E688_9ZZZZ